MSYLALDLATQTGVASWSPGNATPSFWTIRLPGEAGELGSPLERLRRNLADIHALDPITHLFYEAAILPGKTNIQTVLKLCAIAGMAEWFAYRIDAVCRQVDQQSWRKHFLGVGNGKGPVLKSMAIKAAKMRGWNVQNDHEADAAGVLDYGLHCMGVSPPWRDAHLFAVAAA